MILLLSIREELIGDIVGELAEVGSEDIDQCVSNSQELVNVDVKGPDDELVCEGVSGIRILLQCFLYGRVV
mgnify:CR=1 FL=1